MLITVLVLGLGCTSEDASFGNIPMETDPNTSSPPPGEDTDEDTDTPPVDTAATENPCAGKTIGTDIGLCAENFSLQTSSGEMVDLYDFQGEVIYLKLSAFT